MWGRGGDGGRGGHRRWGGGGKGEVRAARSERLIAAPGQDCWLWAFYLRGAASCVGVTCHPPNNPTWWGRQCVLEFLFVCTYRPLSVCLSVFLYACPSVCSTSLFMSVSSCLFLHLFVYLFVFVCLNVFQSFILPVCVYPCTQKYIKFFFSVCLRAGKRWSTIRFVNVSPVYLWTSRTLIALFSLLIHRSLVWGLCRIVWSTNWLIYDL